MAWIVASLFLLAGAAVLVGGCLQARARRNDRDKS